MGRNTSLPFLTRILLLGSSTLVALGRTGWPSWRVKVRPGSLWVLVIGTIIGQPTQGLAKNVILTLVLTAFFVICAPAFTSMHFSSCNSSGHYSLTRQRALRVIAGGSTFRIFGIGMRDLLLSRDYGKTDLMLIN